LEDREFDKGRIDRAVSEFIERRDNKRAGAIQRGDQFHTRKDIQSVDASELLSADLPPIIFLVDGMVSQGLGGLSAKSKLGKSWLGLQLAVALARGDKFL